MCRLAQKHTSIVEKLIVMNVPHNMAMKNHLRSSLSQLMKSWYIFYFQLPVLPELKLQRYVNLVMRMQPNAECLTNRDNYAFLRGLPSRSGIPGKTFPIESKGRYQTLAMTVRS